MTTTTIKIESKEQLLTLIDKSKNWFFFDCFVKNSQFCFDYIDQRFYRVNLWSDNHHSYKSLDDMTKQILRSVKRNNFQDVSVNYVETL